MGIAVVTGVFAVLLAGLSWILNNGSKRGRLLSRIERQAAVLKDLPEGHAARSELDQSLVRDASVLRGLSEQKHASPEADGASNSTTFLGLEWRENRASTVAAVLSAGLALIATLLSLLLEK